MKVLNIHDFPGQHKTDSVEAKVLINADVVMGRDINDGNHFLVYGREAFLEILASRKSQDGILVVELDQRPKSTEAEYLIAMCQVMKGRDEYVEGFDPALEGVCIVGGQFLKRRRE